ncbi:MAG: family 20 glycosylhydrolase [Paraprevotella sp.]|nr:family 20 glycosylhydrolase [Paraprevotella sp.]
MKSLIPALFCMAFSCSNSTAQNLLPLPRKVEMHKGTFRTDYPFRIENEVGASVLNPYDTFITSAAVHNGGMRRIVRYVSDSTLVHPEAYRLHVTPDTVEIAASGHDGYLRAAQTLMQLRTSRGIACCDITDAPAYEWRGVMIDVSRHFFGIDFLKKQIDVLAAYKMNRLHIHLTDAAGWRMEIKRYPRLTEFAAWRTDSLWKTWWNDGKRHYAHEGAAGAYGGYYTQQQLRALNAYAVERGVTLVPEIEMPAHSEEVLAAYPELSCTHEPYRQADFCPGSVATYDFIEHVLDEVMDVFPSTYIHVGGDEAGKASWKDCPRCQQKMKEEGIKDVNGLQEYLIQRVGRYLQSKGRRLLGWDEIIADSLPAGAAVMVWRGTDKAVDAVRRGFDVVLSPGAYCYLDSYQDAPPTQPEAIGGYLPLEKVYGYVPGEGLSAEEPKHIKGVQGNVWSEYVPDERQLEWMLYPRALALAEIGWNGTARKDYAGFRRRALSEVSGLRSRGINAFDLSREVGERKEKSVPVRHKAVGAKVTYNLPAHEYYKASGDGSLTDGKRGGWANNDGCWQGFIRGERFDVVVDLGRVERIHSVSCDFMQACGPEIFFPSSYIVSLSTDGKDFTEVCRQSYPSVKTIQPDVRTYSWKGRTTPARYIRVQAPASAFGGWVFTDEIVVE